jgi:hypothetical protein
MAFGVARIVVIVMENRTIDSLLGAGGTPCPGLAWPPDNSHAAAVAGLPHPGRRCHVPAAQIPVTRALRCAGCMASGHFSEILGPSDPNYLAMMAAASPVAEDLGWFPRLPRMATLADRMDAAGLSWRNYAGNGLDGFAIFPHLRRRAEMRGWRAFAGDARRGELPRLSWLTAPYARSEHPPMPVGWGERWLGQQVAALAAGPCWPDLVAVIVWDDWGGYWDRASPPPLRERWRDGTPFRLGLRTPLLLVGGRVPPGSVFEGPSSHASIPALVERTFGLAPLTDWDADAGDLVRALLPPGVPATPPPRLPRLPGPSLGARAVQGAIDAAAVVWRAAHVPLA